MKVGTDAVLLPCLTDFSNTGHILEIGCGSGVISLIAAQKSRADIMAIDIHEKSVQQAKENFKLSPWHKRLTTKHISLQSFTNIAKKKYDLIISNPPFFMDSMKSPIENRNMARHNDTLSQTDLLESAYQLLKPTGTLSLILPIAEGEIFIQKAFQEGFFLNSRVNIYPKHSKPVNRIIIELGLFKKEAKLSELVIRKENNEYTQAYKELTKDFYLAV